ncbi:uncharacterized protein BDCG_05639 [Blastomyces dermatitidis ER-3]|uniref:Uncharacterized protein n=1 Tax=Ajellomyces dermatitidis (strain ER-3 / ATCC MYA-2586) TaxID=559297 RepID=A0ABP2F305_AJEDR|nr:uncharacterized protein BDCG_05639 [Blastomyces dermatitidis ER-3]EEQ90519.1 hypothetical protein BDCG_05639 [Blastomyces dermatitidis ER-3]EQL28836.1 hypothetical protein BDFG_08466 [Blastomyces dermatitidis ATCC 26199]
MQPIEKSSRSNEVSCGREMWLSPRGVKFVGSEKNSRSSGYLMSSVKCEASTTGGKVSVSSKTLRCVNGLEANPKDVKGSVKNWNETRPLVDFTWSIYLLMVNGLPSISASREQGVK